jgi:hypothetical protein
MIFWSAKSIRMVAYVAENPGPYTANIAQEPDG